MKTDTGVRFDGNAYHTNCVSGNYISLCICDRPYISSMGSSSIMSLIHRSVYYLDLCCLHLISFTFCRFCDSPKASL
jgi:hypothetical protein